MIVYSDLPILLFRPMACSAGTTLFPGSLLSSSLVVEKRDPGNEVRAGRTS